MGASGQNSKSESRFASSKRCGGVLWLDICHLFTSCVSRHCLPTLSYPCLFVNCPTYRHARGIVRQIVWGRHATELWMLDHPAQGPACVCCRWPWCQCVTASISLLEELHPHLDESRPQHLTKGNFCVCPLLTCWGYEEDFYWYN